MTDEELKAGVQKIQTQLAEIQQKSRSKELRGILTDISGWSEETKSDVAIFLHFTYLVQAKNAARSKALHKLFDTLFRKHVSLFGQYINEKMGPVQ